MEFSRPEYWSGQPFSSPGDLPTQGSHPGLAHCRGFCTSWATREAQEYWSGQPVPSPGDLPTQGSPRSRALQGILYQLSHQGSPRILEWAACSSSRGSSRPRHRTRASCIAGGFFTSWATREPQQFGSLYQKPLNRAALKQLFWMCTGLFVFPAASFIWENSWKQWQETG